MVIAARRKKRGLASIPLRQFEAQRIAVKPQRTLDVGDGPNRERAQPAGERLKVLDDAGGRHAIERIRRSFTPAGDAVVLEAEDDVVEGDGAFSSDAKSAAGMELVDRSLDFHETGLSETCLFGKL